MRRIHVLISADEREACRAAAAREGVSMSEWIRQAARDRLAAADREGAGATADLAAFFEALDRTRDDDRPEDDWEAVKARIAAARTPPLPA